MRQGAEMAMETPRSDTPCDAAPSQPKVALGPLEEACVNYLGPCDGPNVVREWQRVESGYARPGDKGPPPAPRAPAAPAEGPAPHAC